MKNKLLHLILLILVCFTLTSCGGFFEEETKTILEVTSYVDQNGTTVYYNILVIRLKCGAPLRVLVKGTRSNLSFSLSKGVSVAFFILLNAKIQ